MRLDTLPNELLDSIGSHVKQHKDLCSLALVCKELRYPAQAALFTPLVVPRRKIRQLLESIVARPDLAKRIHHVDLGDYANHEFTETDRDNLSPSMPGDFEIKSYRKFEEAVTTELGAGTWTDISSLVSVTDAWGPMRSFFLAVLIALAPNLNRLSFEMRPLCESPELLAGLPVALLLNMQRSEAPFCDTIMQLLAPKIQLLDVARNAPGKGPYMHNLSLRSLPKLKRLSIPVDALVRKNTMVNEPCLCLPENLERLQLVAGNKFTIFWMLQLWLDRYKGRLSRLRNLDLFFDSSLRSILIFYSQSGSTRKHAVELVQEALRLRLCSTKTTAYTRLQISNTAGDHEYKVVDIFEELESWEVLSPGEVALAAAKGVELSEAVARNTSGKPRARTDFERRLLLRFWGMPLKLFTSPTFEASEWAGVRMFNGCKGTKKDPVLQHPRPLRQPKHQDQKRKVDEAVPCDECGGAHMMSKEPPQVRSITRTPPKPSALPSPAFHETIWFETEFFPEENIRFPARKRVAKKSGLRKKRTATGGNAGGELVAWLQAITI